MLIISTKADSTLLIALPNQKCSIGYFIGSYPYTSVWLLTFKDLVDRFNHVVQHWNRQTGPDTNPESAVHGNISVYQLTMDSSWSSDKRWLAQDIASKK